MASMTPEHMAAFLATPRLGMLSTLRRDGSPITVPVWFEWDGAAVRIFTGRDDPKVRRLRRDPRASLLVANNVGEPEAWVAFDGAVTIERAGVLELAERLAARYWDMSDPAHERELASWRDAAAHLCVLVLAPHRVRTRAAAS